MKELKSAEDFIWEECEAESDGWQTTYKFNDIVKVMKMYALQAIEAQLEIAAEEATVEKVPHEYYEYRVSESSILRCRRINLE